MMMIRLLESKSGRMLDARNCNKIGTAASNIHTIQKYKKCAGETYSASRTIAVGSCPPANTLAANAVGCASLVRLLNARLINCKRAMA